MAEGNFINNIPETILQKYENIQLKHTEGEYIFATAQNRALKIPVILKILKSDDKNVAGKKSEILIRLISNVMCESYSPIYRMRYEFCLDAGKCCFVYEEHTRVTSGLIQNLSRRTVSRREKHFNMGSMNSTENAQTGIWQGMSIDQYLRDLQKQIEKYSDAMNKTIQKYLQQKSSEFDRSILDSAQVNQVLFREFDGTLKLSFDFNCIKLCLPFNLKSRILPHFQKNRG